MQILKGIATATASRDLKFGIQEKILERKGEKNRAVYRYRSF